MRLLLDTHTFLWWSDDHHRLTRAARHAIANADAVYVSVASAWEVAVKTALRKLRLDVPFEHAVEINRFSGLPVEFRHAAVVATLPLHHTDPFDRILVAQTQVEGLTLVTHDHRFEPYRIPVLWT